MLRRSPVRWNHSSHRRRHPTNGRVCRPAPWDLGEVTTVNSSEQDEPTPQEPEWQQAAPPLLLAGFDDEETFETHIVRAID